MAKKKRLSFIASIFEIIVSSIFFISAVVFALIFISGSSFVYNSTENIIWMCAYFVFAILLMVDGIFSLKLTRASDDRFRKSLRPMLGIGITISAVNVFGLALSSINNIHLHLFMCLFWLNIAISSLKITASSISETTPISEATDKSVENVNKVQTSSQNLEMKLEKLAKLTELYNNKLITEEEFNILKGNILK